jgi:hypothetical protein
MADSDVEVPLIDVHNIMCVIEDAAKREGWAPRPLVLALIQEAVKVAGEHDFVKDATVQARLSFAIEGSRGNGVEALKEEFVRLERDGLVSRA